MRVAWVVALSILAGCSTRASQPEPAAGLEANPVVACTDPRPELCTMQYDPVCASLVVGGDRTYPSACSACADEAVAGYRSGSCSE